jgi:hypothetical protein
MDQTKTTLERAFELAKSGKVASVTHLRAQIKSEGYTQQQIDGPALGRQLRILIARARSGLLE